YEFFRDLLPPLRYVNTSFRHYPIVLCAPSAPVKARWVSNGSAVNARANKPPMWREVGIPVAFQVGDPAEPFGEDPERLDGPRYVEGYLPIVRVTYVQGAATYEEEVFAPVRGELAERGAVLVRFQVQGAPGTIEARIDSAQPVHAEAGAIRDPEQRAILLHDTQWTWDGEPSRLRARLEPGCSAVLAVLTQPLPPPLPSVSEARYEEERTACAARWKALLERGARWSIPESIVQDAWRSLVVGNFLIAVGDRMHYSAGNAYDHLYEAECGDAVRALLLYGFTDEARRMVGPLLDFNRPATRYHVAGHKLQLLAHYYAVTRDADYLRVKEPVWAPVLDFILQSRQPEHGLLLPDNYAGDISQQVYSLNSNANCWRGLRDMAVILDDLGEHERSRELRRQARSFREAILAAVAQSEQRDVEPPFIPNALFGVEKAYETLTATRLGSYYDLMAPYIIGSGVFSPGSERETWMIDYLRRHGGIAMGMIRTTPHQGQFAEQPGVNVLYGLRYQLALLRRDDRDHALVGFYGQLAQGMTRDTFIGGEGSRFFHGDHRGRSFYLPPNSASNAMFLTTLRYLLLQDWDLDDDGCPETLRLLYGAPRRWLRDGAVLEVERAPTMFGPVSLRVESRLSDGEVLVTLASPPRRPAKLLLRLPLPPGWKTASAQVGHTELPVGRDGAIDLSSQSGRITVRVRLISS
ncbi:MAG: hypothetical protein IRY99_17475, partial [Isosphaeraceae bacterium]|nr:hypothetical protein [Isosphaeraceae bacterium]